MKKIFLILLLVAGFLIYRDYGYLGQSVTNYIPSKTEEIQHSIEGLNVPDGFAIDYFAKNVEGARSMTISDSGIVYVGTRKQGVVHAIQDTDGNNISDRHTVIADDLNSPNGVVWHEGDLYVAEIDRILKFENIDDTFSNNPTFTVVYEDLPSDTHHGWKYIDIGPDGKLYVPIGAPCNICQTDNTSYATLNRLNLDGSEFEVIAKGIRNTVGFDWHPTTNTLYFTENGRDWFGDDLPPDEFNILEQVGEHFGYPACHGIGLKDDEFGGESCEKYKSPLVEMGPHVAALGMKFYTGTMFPEEFRNIAFIAEHGSWNRTVPIGYRITTVDPNDDSFEVFADGWLNENGDAWGRPVDVEQMADGSLLVSDDLAGVIYRISYKN